MIDVEMVVGSGLLAAVFLGGFPGGVVLGFVQFVVKTLFVIFLLSLMRALTGPDPRRPGRHLLLEGTWPRWPSSSS